MNAPATLTDDVSCLIDALTEDIDSATDIRTCYVRCGFALGAISSVFGWGSITKARHDELRAQFLLLTQTREALILKRMGV